jgi:hypothetical protein
VLTFAIFYLVELFVFVVMDKCGLCLSYGGQVVLQLCELGVRYCVMLVMFSVSKLFYLVPSCLSPKDIS